LPATVRLTTEPINFSLGSDPWNEKVAFGFTTSENTVPWLSPAVIVCAVLPLYRSVKVVIPPWHVKHVPVAGQSHDWLNEQNDTSRKNDNETIVLIKCFEVRQLTFQRPVRQVLNVKDNSFSANCDREKETVNFRVWHGGKGIIFPLSP
jgi:hypothetical protein